MSTPEQIAAAWQRLRDKWGAEGACNSCGWHGLLYEHYVEDDDIAEALDSDGILRLSCVSKYTDDPSMHRGVRIFIGEERAA